LKTTVGWPRVVPDVEDGHRVGEDVISSNGASKVPRGSAVGAFSDVRVDAACPIRRRYAVSTLA
jgi:hypothetical protein